MSRYLAMVVIGVGIGIGVGAMTDGAAHGYAWAVLLVGLALLLVRPGTRPAALGVPDEPPGTRREREPRPTLTGLGPRVGEILRLAEQQAENQVAKARQEAERILRDARVEADKILARAADDAGPRSGYAAPLAPEDGSAEGHR
ncbi:hypothetical protein AB0J90_22430 [Micromonospora sp. NPDC049523]|uniref:DivIVA domain-containing protein n=1 Tax=Micromonospora sp. NPDC049523 TaxID=3155921 RepID=UPI0034363B3B